METQKILEPEGKIVIVSDHRERELIENLEKLGAKVNILNLEVGDFVCSDRVCVERKTHSDFISSIIDGRIFEQAEALKKNFEKPVIVVEGLSNREINENVLKSTIASLITNYSISFINTRNPQDTAKTIYWLAKKEQDEGKHNISFKVGKKPKETKKLQEFIVASIPGVSTVLAKRLLKYFGSIEKIIIASENELQKVKGIRKNLSIKIKKTLTAKYN